MSPLELAAAAFGVVNIILIARRTVLNYPFGIVMVALYADVFYRARLYGAAGLQVFFLAAQVYGWWYWTRSRTGSDPVPVRQLSARGWAIALAAGIAGTTVLGLGMSRLTDAAQPWWDAANAAWSMVAQLLTDRRLVAGWPLWIAIDALSVWLYASQHLLATAALYAIFGGIAAWGWAAWARAAPAAAPAAG